MLKLLRWLVLGGLLLGGCTEFPAEMIVTLVPAATRAAPSEAAFAEGIEVYFTDPTSPLADDYHGGPDELLAEAIDQAETSVEMAMYDFNIWGVRDALMRAFLRGVAVRVVTESEHIEEEELQELKALGIPVVGDGREGLMHNKFLIIDGQEVWTGSTNLTAGGVYRNDNNLVRLRSRAAAENYLAEFEEMYTEKEFGGSSPENTPQPQFEIAGTRVEVYFSPEDYPAKRIVELLRTAEESIVFMAFSFTADPIADAMLERMQAGVTVSGVFEEDQYRSNQGTEFDRLLGAGAGVFLDVNPDQMHHKVIVIDGEVVVTGSYNFSRSAEERNDENVVVIFDAAIAQKYLAEFEELQPAGW